MSVPSLHRFASAIRRRLGARRTRFLCLAGLLVLVPSVVHAQTPPQIPSRPLAHPLVPKGRVRFDFVPSLSTWDTRYGLFTKDGAAVEGEEALGSDFTDPDGVSLFPGVTTLEDVVRSLSGDAGYQAHLGSTVGEVTKEITRLDMGVRLGVFDWLTVGANVPYVKGRTVLDFAFRADSMANLGINPALGSGTEVGDILTALGDVAVATEQWAQTTCSSSSGDCQAATALSDRATEFWTGLLSAYFASPFFPLANSMAASQMASSLESLNAALTAAGLTAVSAPLAFATAGVDEETFGELPTDPALGIAGAPLGGVDGIWQLGDVELNATVRLLESERWTEGDPPRFAYGIYGGFLVRLPTGALDSPDFFLDLASGDAQMDMEGRVDGLFRVGGRLGFRAGFRYGVQRSVDIVRRVAPPEGILPMANTARVVTWEPGSYTFLELSPRFHVSEPLSLAVDYRRYHKGEDTFSLVTEETSSTPSVEASVLARETEVTLQELAFGLRYSSLSVFRQGKVGTPAEIGVRVIRPLSGSGGQAPKATRLEFSISLFRRLWGQ